LVTYFTEKAKVLQHLGGKSFARLGGLCDNTAADYFDYANGI
jgi:hypothetical protein